MLFSDPRLGPHRRLGTESYWQWLCLGIGLIYIRRNN
jgi:hypothetical protein